MINFTLFKGITRALFCTLLLFGYANGQEIKLIRVVNDSAITNFDLAEQEKIIKFVVNFLNIESATEKLTCDLKQTKLSNFVLCGFSEDIVLDDYLNKVAQSLPDCKVTKEEILGIINKIASDRKISNESFAEELQKRDISLENLIEFIGKEFRRSKIVRKIFEDVCFSIQEDELFRMALTNGFLADVKLEYLCFSQPYNKKGLQLLLKTRANLQKAENIPKGIKKNFLTEIADADIAASLLKLDENSTSMIWKSDNNWKMVHLCKRKMINPDLSRLNNNFQIFAALKMQGNIQKLFSQVEGSSFVRELK
jgi:hypothetical protein